MLGLLNHGAGRVAVYGDSNCLDSSHQRSNCFDLLRSLLEFATEVRAALRYARCTGSWSSGMPPSAIHTHPLEAFHPAHTPCLQGGQELLTAEVRLTDPFGSYDKLPARRTDYDFKMVSPVLNEPLRYLHV